MTITHPDPAKTADTILEVLSWFGLPGAAAARRAIQGVENLRQSEQARLQLKELLEAAEAEFVRQAQQEEGLRRAAEHVLMLPQQNRPAFEQALKAMLQQWDDAAPRQVLAEEFAQIKGLDDHARCRALALYMTTLSRCLWRHETFRPLLRDLTLLRVEQDTEKILNLAERIRWLLEDSLAALRWQVQPPPAEGGLRPYLLAPKYRLTAYGGAGFVRERDELVKWAEGLADGGQRQGLRIYLGGGGSGKTRLLIEAGELLRGRGWRTAFAAAGSLNRQNVRSILEADLRPTLLVLDYAAGRQGEVEALLNVMAFRRGESGRPPLAVVLLEREMPAWLKEMLGRSSDTQYTNLPELLCELKTEPRWLPEMSAGERLELFEQARQRFIELAGAPPPQRITYTAEELPERPLAVSLLALHAAAGERLEGASQDEGEVYGFTWRRERAAWERLLRSEDETLSTPLLKQALEVVEDLNVIATLGRQFAGPKGVETFLRQHENFWRTETAEGKTLSLAWLAERLAKLFPQAALSKALVIVPDPLADYVLLERLKQREELLKLTAPAAQEAREAPAAAAGLSRALLDTLVRLWAAGVERERVQGWLERLAQALPSGERAFLDELEERLPQRSVPLGGVRLWLHQAQLELLGAEEAAERARLLNNLGAILSELGRLEEALAAAQEAAGVYRELARTRPEAFLPGLAMSLNNLGSRLSGLGRLEEALAAAQEAVSIRRELARTRPQAFLPDLAGSLNNLSVFLSGLGRREEALAAAQEAAGVYRELARTRPEAFLPGLAGSLNNLGNILSGLGRLEEALAAAQEAVSALKPFFLALPQAFAPWMEVMLGNYLRFCQALNRPPDVLLVAEIAGKLQSLQRGAESQKPKG